MGLYFHLDAESKKNLEDKYTKLIREKANKTQVKISYDNYSNKVLVMIFKITDHTETIGEFTLSIFPDSYDTMISHDLYLREEIRNLGIGPILKELKYEIMKLNEERLNHILCVVNKQNDVELHMMEKFGWKQIYDMKTHFIFIKDLDKEE